VYKDGTEIDVEDLKLEVKNFPNAWPFNYKNT
jgi:hypothetical protein